MNPRLAKLISVLHDLVEELDKSKDEVEHEDLFETFRDVLTLCEPRDEAIQRIHYSVRCPPLRLWIRYLQHKTAFAVDRRSNRGKPWSLSARSHKSRASLNRGLSSSVDGRRITVTPYVSLLVVVPSASALGSH